MKKSIDLWQIIGFGITSLLGSILHFLYDLLGGALYIAPFSGINESTWEHMKLLFWPMFVFAIVQSFFFKDIKEFWCIKLRGTIWGLILIPVIFYTYNGVIGKSPDWINISIFYISAAIAYFYETKLFKNKKIQCILPKFSFLILIIIGLCFFIFTFYIPNINLFKDPLNCI